MAYVKSKNKFVHLSLGLIPLIMSIIFVANKSIILLIATIISMFFVIGISPICKYRESIWMFLLVAVISISINLPIILYLVFDGLFSNDWLLSQLLWCGFLHCIFFSVEEIIFGVATRFIWKKQYKITI